MLNRLKRAIGIKNKHAVGEIKEHGKLLAAIILDEKDRDLSRKERIERFKDWQKEQGV
jgi:hypothetical protein